MEHKIGMDNSAHVNDVQTNGQSSQNGSAFLQQLFEILLEDGVEKGTSVTRYDETCLKHVQRLYSKVVEFLHPKELFKKFDLEFKDEGDSDERLLELCKETIKYSVRTGHPRFFNQLYQGFNPYGLGGAWLTETVNTSQYTFEVAPVFTLMEEVTLRKLRECVGFSDGDGIFCPGGSVSNMYGINLARFKQFPGVKEEGLHSLPPLCILTSDQVPVNSVFEAATCITKLTIQSSK